MQGQALLTSDSGWHMEPAGNRSWWARANHGALPPGLDPAGPHAGLTMSGSSLTNRVRLLFCLLTVISVLLRGMLLPFSGAPVWPDIAVAVLALAGLTGWSVWLFRRSRVPLAFEAVVPLGLLLWGPVSGQPASVLTMLLAALFQRALYGRAPRVFANAIAYFAAYLVVDAEMRGARALLDPATLTNTVGVVFCAWLMYTLGRALRLHEESARGEAVVARAGGGLMAAQSAEEVYDAVLTALDELTGDLAATVTLWRMRGEWIEEVAARGTDTLSDRITRVAAADIPEEMLQNLAAGHEFFVDRHTRAALIAQLQPASEREPIDDDLELLICPLQENGKPVGSVVIMAEHVPARLRQLAVQIAVQAGLVLERLTLHQVVRGVVDESADTFVTVDVDGRIQFVSAAVRTTLGYEPDALVGAPLADLVHPDDAPALQTQLNDRARLEAYPEPVACRLRHREGAWRHAEISPRSVTGSDGLPAVLLNVRDVTYRKALEAEIAFRAYHDGLTGLANRMRFAERLEQALERARRTRAIFAVVFLDIDDFKTVNDSLGHTAGDRLLEVVARRLKARLRPHDVAARFGGDEFAVLIEDAGNPRDIDSVVCRLVHELAEPVALDTSLVTPRASVGLVVVTDADTTTGSEIMRDADIAMYAAKRAGKGRMVRFHDSMRVAVQEKLRLRAALGGALDRGEFALEYQPVLSLASGRIEGAEALLRWHHPEFGLMSPDQFIPLAEEDGTIVPIDRWVVFETCRQLRSWLDRSGSRDLVVGVNVSARNFQDDQVVDMIADALHTHGVPATSLIVEITESTLIVDTDNAGRILNTLRRLGVGVAIDDFGNGYSSLSYLQRFPVDYLKVDRSFISGIGCDPGSGALAHAIVRLAGTLGVTAIAEGIELDQQASSLRRWGCQLGQGFLFARPTPPDGLSSMLASPQRVS